MKERYARFTEEIRAVSYTHLDVYKRQVLPGLKPGLYTVEEVQAPGGYLLLKEPLKIQITNEEERQVFTVRNQKLEVDILKTCLLYTSRCV